MAAYNTPNYDINVFNPSSFIFDSETGGLSKDEADLLYLKFPIAQGDNQLQNAIASNMNINQTLTTSNITHPSMVEIGSPIIKIGRPGDSLIFQGTSQTINTTNLDIQDNIITLNKGGNCLSAINGGIEIECDGIIKSSIKLDQNLDFVVNSTNNKLRLDEIAENTTGHKILFGSDIDMGGKNINIAGGNIQNSFKISGNTNTDLILQSQGSNNITLQTLNTDRVIVSSSQTEVKNNLVGRSDMMITNASGTNFLRYNVADARLGINKFVPLYTLDVNGTSNISGNAIFSSTTPSISNITGGVIMSGGLGVAGAVNALSVNSSSVNTGNINSSSIINSGIANFTSMIPSLSLTSGAVVISGGLAVAKNIFTSLLTTGGATIKSDSGAGTVQQKLIFDTHQQSRGGGIIFQTSEVINSNIKQFFGRAYNGGNAIQGLCYNTTTTNEDVELLGATTKLSILDTGALSVGVAGVGTHNINGLQTNLNTPSVLVPGRLQIGSAPFNPQPGTKMSIIQNSIIDNNNNGSISGSVYNLFSFGGRNWCYSQDAINDQILYFGGQGGSIEDPDFEFIFKRSGGLQIQPGIVGLAPDFTEALSVLGTAKITGALSSGPITTTSLNSVSVLNSGVLSSGTIQVNGAALLESCKFGVRNTQVDIAVNGTTSGTAVNLIQMANAARSWYFGCDGVNTSEFYLGVSGGGGAVDPDFLCYWNALGQMMLQAPTLGLIATPPAAGDLLTVRGNARIDNSMTALGGIGTFLGQVPYKQQFTKGNPTSGNFIWVFPSAYVSAPTITATAFLAGETNMRNCLITALSNTSVTIRCVRTDNSACENTTQINIIAIG